MVKCLKCEGYKMFEGAAEVRGPGCDHFTISGVWLYRPDTDRWYVNYCAAFPWGSSFPADSVTPITGGGDAL